MIYILSTLFLTPSYDQHRIALLFTLLFTPHTSYTTYTRSSYPPLSLSPSHIYTHSLAQQVALAREALCKDISALHRLVNASIAALRNAANAQQK